MSHSEAGSGVDRLILQRFRNLVSHDLAYTMNVVAKHQTIVLRVDVAHLSEVLPEK